MSLSQQKGASLKIFLIIFSRETCPPPNERLSESIRESVQGACRRSLGTPTDMGAVLLRKNDREGFGIRVSYPPLFMHFSKGADREG